MSFKGRIGKHEIAIEKFDNYCDLNGIIYAKTGYEDLVSNNGIEFKKIIQQIDNNTANRIRFFPDRIAILEDVILVEIKNSKSIEKDAYKSYIDLYKIGYNVGIVFLVDEELKFAKINELVIKKAYSYNIPVEEGLWYAPRKMEETEYFKWKEKYPSASGTTYGYIDFNNTEFRILNSNQRELPFVYTINTNNKSNQSF